MNTVLFQVLINLKISKKLTIGYLIELMLNAKNL